MTAVIARDIQSSENTSTTRGWLEKIDHKP